MSMHEDFKAPVSHYNDVSPETIQYHIARARVLRSQALTSHLAGMVKMISKLFTRHADTAENAPGSAGFAANQS